MRTTSQTWDELYASDGGHLETKAIINGAEYTNISAPVISRSAMQDAMSVGNVISASCVLSVKTTNIIPKSAQVQILSRYTDGETSSDWMSMGTFYISRRIKDPLNRVITIECYDALLKANAPASLTLPASMADVADAIADAIGLNIDSRTSILTGSAYTINSIPASATYRDVLGTIAAANCGNFIVTPDNNLRLVPIVTLPDPEDELTDLVTVKTFTGTIEVGDERTVSGVLYTDGDAIPVLIGDETGIVVNVALTYAQATAMAQTIIGTTYKPYTITDARYNPAAEIGDYVIYSDRILNVIWTENAQYGVEFTGNVTAPEFGDIEDEFPYIGAAQKGLTDAKAYAAEIVEASIDDYDDALTQQKVFNRLTGNGTVQGLYMVGNQLYVNASYIQSGTLTLGGANDTNGVMQVLDANGNEVVLCNNRGISITNGELSVPIAYQDTGESGSFVSINGPSGVVIPGVPGRRTDFRAVYVKSANEKYETVIDKCKLSLRNGVLTARFTPPATDITWNGITVDTGDPILGYWGMTVKSFADYDVDEHETAIGVPGKIELNPYLLRFTNTENTGTKWFELVPLHMYYSGNVNLSIPLGVASGGTGASTAAGARTNIGAQVDVGLYIDAQGYICQHISSDT